MVPACYEVSPAVVDLELGVVVEDVQADVPKVCYLPSSPLNPSPEFLQTAVPPFPPQGGPAERLLARHWRSLRSHREPNQFRPNLSFPLGLLQFEHDRSLLGLRLWHCF